MTARATFEDTVLAESDETIVVEGNHYFPPSSVRHQYLIPSDTHTHCSWKGDASYYTVTVNGSTKLDAAWFYEDPLPAAEAVADYVAFWRGVRVTDEVGDGRPGPQPPGRP